MKFLKKYERDSSLQISQNNLNLEEFKSISNIIATPKEDLKNFIFKIEGEDDSDNEESEMDIL